MKNYIWIFFFTISGFSQNLIDLTPEASVIRYGTGFVENEPEAEITKWDDDTIEVRGDTLCAIRILFNLLEKKSDEQEEQRQALQSAVDFTNSIPAYFCKGKRWKAYMKQLRKQGYR